MINMEEIMTSKKNAKLWTLAIAGATTALAVGCATTSGPTGDNRHPASDGAATPQLNPAFERALPNEPQLVQKIIDGMLTIQQLDATPDGKLHRGTHAKGTCVGGTLEIYDLDAKLSDRTLAGRLKKGMFSRAGRYPTVVRFANAEGKIQSDTMGDVRAISLAVSTPPDISNPQGRMDFAMNDFPVFPIKDAQVFADVMILPKLQVMLGKDPFALQNLPGSIQKIGLALANSEHVPPHEVLQRSINLCTALGVGAEQTHKIDAQHPLKPYQKMTYWSDVPFALGSDEAVKYVLVPCAGNQAQPLTQDADTLSTEILRHVNNDRKMGCFELQVQVLGLADPGVQVPERSPQDWVEDALTEWPFKAIPVGRLTLTAKSALDAATCEARRIDVTNNNSETHRGLGSINRARVAAEAASAAKRGGH